MKELLTKDLRRGFVNRNKNCVPTVDLVQIVGKSDQLDLENPSLAEKSVQTALGQRLEAKRAAEDRSYRPAMRVAIVTARNHPADERSVTTLPAQN